MSDIINNASIYRKSPTVDTSNEIPTIEEWQRQGYTSQEQMDREIAFYKDPSLDIGAKSIGSHKGGSWGRRTYAHFNSGEGQAWDIDQNLWLKDGKRDAFDKMFSKVKERGRGAITLKDIYKTYGRDTTAKIAKQHLDRQDQRRKDFGGYWGDDYFKYREDVNKFIDKLSDEKTRAMTPQEKKAQKQIADVFKGTSVSEETYKKLGMTAEDHQEGLKKIFKDSEKFNFSKGYKGWDKVKESKGKTLKEVMKGERKFNPSTRGISKEGSTYKGENRAGINKIVKSNRMP